MADRDSVGVHAGGLERRDGPLHRVGGAADDGLAGAVDVCDDDVPVGFGDDALDLGERGEHGGHGAVVAHRQIRHLAAPGADRLQRGVEGQRTGGDQSAVFAEAVAHHHVRAHAVRVEHAGQRQVGGQHRRLGDLGLHELLFEPLGGGLVGVVREDVFGQRLTEQWRHHPVGLVECRGDQRLLLAKVAQHVDVLRALAGVEERDLSRCAAADEYALGAQDLPHGGVAAPQRLHRLARLGRQVARVGIVDRDPHRRARQGGVWCGRGGHTPGRRLGAQPLEPGGHLGVVCAAHDRGAPQRRLPSSGRRYPRRCGLVFDRRARE